MTREEEHDRPRNIGGLIKVAVKLAPSDWHSWSVETLWAASVAPGKARVQNVPFAAYGLSFNDVIETEEAGGRCWMKSITERGGHSTYRVFLNDGVEIDSASFQSRWKRLEEEGCTRERATRRLVCIDVPPEADVHRVYEILESGEAAETWGFEEAHCGHRP